MINLKNVSHAYHKNRPVLSDINLEIKAGHIYGLLGENGAGKSTLLKAIAGMVFPQQGEVTVLGHRPLERTPEFLSQLFFIPEEFSLPPVKISTYLDTYAPFYKDFDQDLFYQLISDFDVIEAAYLDQLSFGQKKKVFIAFGLATQTRLLLMDEPTNGLDIPSKSQFRKIIASTLTEDRCIIISTHQVRDLDNLIDELIILSKERIVLSASIDQICTQLSFKVLKETNEKVVYAEQTISGINAILANTEQEDTKIDIELFFKAMLLKEPQLSQLLKPTTINHEQHI
ncbi:MAG TPA: ABC transporter ATP-binding protein [Sphingobacteriaceae bacterium]|nr:ABC transporter ATP-binding protein [Sphingobacteriaceae bacterium]